MKEKLITEFLGTFFLYSIIGLTAVLGGAGNMAPLAIGVGLAALIFASGHRSKAHFNPAVTLAFLTSKNQPTKEFIPYIITACLAAVSAAYCVQFIQPEAIAEIKLSALGLQHKDDFKLIPALISEFLFTFALVWVILNVAVAKGTQGNGFYGLAIGFTVAAGAYSVGSISGASFNPAVNIGLFIHQVIDLKILITYSLVQLLAGFSAALIFKCIEHKEAESCSIES